MRNTPFLLRFWSCLAFEILLQTGLRSSPLLQSIQIWFILNCELHIILETFFLNQHSQYDF